MGLFFAVPWSTSPGSIIGLPLAPSRDNMYRGATDVARIACHIVMLASSSGPVMRRVENDRIRPALLVPMSIWVVTTNLSNS